jgi:hypothetical protein
MGRNSLPFSSSTRPDLKHYYFFSQETAVELTTPSPFPGLENDDDKDHTTRLDGCSTLSHIIVVDGIDSQNINLFGSMHCAIVGPGKSHMADVLHVNHYAAWEKCLLIRWGFYPNFQSLLLIPYLTI